jgi:hypothetical protein
VGKVGPDGRDVPSTRPLLDKLGVKAGQKISVLGLRDKAFLDRLGDRSRDVSSRPRKGSDLIFVYMREREDLSRLGVLRPYLKPAGAIWVLWRKGRKTFREDDIRSFGPDVGFVDVKVVAFSATLSALKMVIPLALRPSVDRATRPGAS